eukprot:XP_011611605.1 PREDICTED: RAD51-associated protein 1 isoform X1 [Takifugu rubripes]
MDRPSRKAKAVNYCESRDNDDEEDFAFAKAPPSKKARESGKQEAKKSSSQDSQSTASQQNRKPLDERLHERDLEAALTLSLLNSSNEREDQAKGVAKVQVVADENTDPTSLYLSNCSVDSTVLGLDEISAEKETLVKQRKAAAKAAAESRKTLKDEDEDYEPKASPESDSDFSEPAESEDEEFTVKNVSKTKKRVKEKSRQVKAAPASKKAKPAPQPAKVKSPGGAAATPVRSPPVAKVAHKRPVSSSAVPASRPALSPIPAGGRVPKWNPPAQVGRSPSSSQSTDVRSPGQGLRLGLSRLVRVKPLHPSVASH